MKDHTRRMAKDAIFYLWPLNTLTPYETDEMIEYLAGKFDLYGRDAIAEFQETNKL